MTCSCTHTRTHCKKKVHKGPIKQNLFSNSVLAVTTAPEPKTKGAANQPHFTNTLHRRPSIMDAVLKLLGHKQASQTILVKAWIIPHLSDERAHKKCIIWQTKLVNFTKTPRLLILKSTLFWTALRNLQGLLTVNCNNSRPNSLHN